MLMALWLHGLYLLANCARFTWDSFINAVPRFLGPAFTSVPVQEGFAAEHGREVLRHALEHLLDGRGVSSEGHRHLEALARDPALKKKAPQRSPLLHPPPSHEHFGTPKN